MGPAIGVETIGEGPAIVLVDGAFGSQAWARMSALASARLASGRGPRPINLVLGQKSRSVVCAGSRSTCGLAPLVIDGRR
jgi:hypothetical protein